MDSNQQVVIVTGGSRGLGLAIIRRLVTQGHQVATFSRSESPELQNIADSDRLLWRSVDAQDAGALREFVKQVHQYFGRIDALINNAGIAHDGVLALARDEDISQMLDVNLKAAILLAKECSRHMLVQESGHIINVSSIIAERGFSGLTTYAATKAGMIGLTRSLARELGSRNIRANAVAPGYLDTDMSQELDETQRAQICRRTPLGRLGKTNDVVPVIEFLLSPASGFITGQVIVVDGGASV